MGCCLSTTSKTSKTNPDVVPPKHRHHFPESGPDGGPPPPTPPLLEEETVKEVLSETPIPKPSIPIVNYTSNNNKKNQQQPVVEEVKIQPTPMIKPAEEMNSEVSEVSEMCTFSESLSTVSDKREDDGEVTQRVYRSPAKIPRKRPKVEVTGEKEKGFRSPARRSEPPLVKRTHVASTSVQARTMTSTRRNVGPPNAVRALRRDPVEDSGRRSRSPVTPCEAGTHRPVRYKSSTLTPTVRMPEATAESVGGREKRGDEALPETTESLENPLVSMECFIFL